jgi:hypothetical protein
MTDMEAYVLYVKYCEMLKIKPAPFDYWVKHPRSIRNVAAANSQETTFGALPSYRGYGRRNK